LLIGLPGSFAALLRHFLRCTVAPVFLTPMGCAACLLRGHCSTV
jgi:hypothetical protein